MNALDIWVNAYRNTDVGDVPPVDDETYDAAVVEFQVLVKARDQRAIQAHVYAEDRLGHDPAKEHTHVGKEESQVLRQALLAYAGSIENGWEAGE